MSHSDIICVNDAYGIGSGSSIDAYIVDTCYALTKQMLYTLVIIPHDHLTCKLYCVSMENTYKSSTL